MKAIYFDGDNGEVLRITEIPNDYLNEAKEQREIMLDDVSVFSDDLMVKILMEEEIAEEDIYEAIKKGVRSLQLTPVYLGSAYKNKGVQPLLDAISRYLPSPNSAAPSRVIDENSNEIELVSDPEKPFIAMAFKITEEKFGQLTYIRVYQGTMNKGDTVYNTRTKKKSRVSRLVRLHANDKENITSVSAGDIVAMVGVDCASGDTFVSSYDDINLSCEGMHIPIPVIELSITTKDKEQLDRMSKGLSRFLREDPTFHVYIDKESEETRIAGMGELHLEIYLERLRREYNVNLIVGQPQVNYKETIRKGAKFDYTHKKQTGGAGQFAKVVGEIIPLALENKEKEDQIFKFTNQIKGATIPTEYIGSCEAGFNEGIIEGPLAKFPLVDVEVVLVDGKHHPVDSSDMAFKTASKMAMKEALKKAGGVLLEPIMKVEVETTDEYQGSVIGDLSSRRGMILGTELGISGELLISAEAPLSAMFGYASDLRSLTSGKASFTMEFCRYSECPTSITEEVIKSRN